MKEENFFFQTRNSVIPKRRVFKTFSTTYIKNEDLPVAVAFTRPKIRKKRKNMTLLQAEQ